MRSEKEFQEDHIPGAINYPVLNNSEREIVGTLYKTDTFAGKKLGAALITKNISKLLADEFAKNLISWNPLIYCWRGGERSNALALILNRIGFKVFYLDGGYKSYRKFVLKNLSEKVSHLKFKVICGLTGSGKTRFLEIVRQKGHQVLDLEGLAKHSGSLLGAHPHYPQPSQKYFETLLHSEICCMNDSKVVYVESESKKIGNRHVPDCLINKIRQSECIWLDVPLEIRVQNLIDSYQHLINQPLKLKHLLSKFKGISDENKIKEYTNYLELADWTELVKKLLVCHYDPLYKQSINKNFSEIRSAVSVEFIDPSNHSSTIDELPN